MAPRVVARSDPLPASRLVVWCGVIICGTDLGPSGEAAARWAAALARALGHPLTLVHVDDAAHQSLTAFPSSVREAAATFHSRLDEQRSAHEDALLQLGQSLGMEFHHVALAGRPSETLLDFAAEQAASMVVIGPHATGLGSTARRVVMNSRTPVLVTGAGEPPDFRTLPWVVGLSQDARAAPLVAHIGAVAAKTGCEMVVTRVLPEMPHRESSEAQALLTEVDAATREELQHLETDLGLRVTAHITTGAPAEVLLAEARARGAGVAVAAHGDERPRDKLRHFFLGSVTESVLRDAAGVAVFVSPGVM